jgi:hypothetical protein
LVPLRPHALDFRSDQARVFFQVDARELLAHRLS